SGVIDRLWRAEASRTRARGGPGHGLAIGQAVVHALHGTVRITSHTGSGTAVTVTLPALPPRWPRGARGGQGRVAA
ncbi:cell wall metabolism sensor histidine kinase WalK, partial [Streptomyces sp. GbtcB7]|uniref:cell wall metabolism sensor histidine kinase WalK n=1 Tax=Streptomyces sp. GbtcB7 TaxID=2824752 RepID=UPI001C30D2DC